MSDNNGWAGQPGVPMNPEWDGWHWVCGHSPAEKPHPQFWSLHSSGLFSWWSGMMWREDTAARHWRYLRPCSPDDLSPAEVDARIAAAREELQAENARLQEALARAKDLFLQDESLGAFIEVCAALGETQ